MMTEPRSVWTLLCLQMPAASLPAGKTATHQMTAVGAVQGDRERVYTSRLDCYTPNDCRWGCARRSWKSLSAGTTLTTKLDFIFFQRFWEYVFVDQTTIIKMANPRNLTALRYLSMCTSQYAGSVPESTRFCQYRVDSGTSPAFYGLFMRCCNHSRNKHFVQVQDICQFRRWRWVLLGVPHFLSHYQTRPCGGMPG